MLRPAKVVLGFHTLDVYQQVRCTKLDKIETNRIQRKKEITTVKILMETRKIDERILEIESDDTRRRTLIFYLHILDMYYNYYDWFDWYSRAVKDRRAVLEDKQRFPDSSFSASASSEGHSASDARISSGSSWCAPVSNDKHYLEVDLRRPYQLYSVVTYGDSTSSKWVATYSLNYTVDLLNWETWVRSNYITKI